MALLHNRKNLILEDHYGALYVILNEEGAKEFVEWFEWEVWFNRAYSPEVWQELEAVKQGRLPAMEFLANIDEDEALMQHRDFTVYPKEAR